MINNIKDKDSNKYNYNQNNLERQKKEIIGVDEIYDFLHNKVDYIFYSNFFCWLDDFNPLSEKFSKFISENKNFLDSFTMDEKQKLLMNFLKQLDWSTLKNNFYINILSIIYKLDEYEIAIFFNEFINLIDKNIYQLLDFNNKISDLLEDDQYNLQTKNKTQARKETNKINKKIKQLIDDIFFLSVFYLVQLENNIDINKLEKWIILSTIIKNKNKEEFNILFWQKVNKIIRKIEQNILKNLFQDKIDNLIDLYNLKFINNLDWLKYSFDNIKELTEKNFFYLIWKYINSDLIKKIYSQINKKNVKDYIAYTNGIEIFVDIEKIFYNNFLLFKNKFSILKSITHNYINQWFLINSIEGQNRRKFSFMANNKQQTSKDDIKKLNKIGNILINNINLLNSFIEEDKNKWYKLLNVYEKIDIFNLNNDIPFIEKTDILDWICNCKEIENETINKNKKTTKVIDKKNEDNLVLIYLLEPEVLQIFKLFLGIKLIFNSIIKNKLVGSYLQQKNFKIDIKFELQRLNLLSSSLSKKYFLNDIQNFILNLFKDYFHSNYNYNSNNEKENPYEFILNKIYRFYLRIKKENKNNIGLSISEIRIKDIVEERIKNLKNNYLDTCLINTNFIPEINISKESYFNLIINSAKNIITHEILHIIFRSIDKDFYFEKEFNLQKKFIWNIVNIVDDSYINETVLLDMLNEENLNNFLYENILWLENKGESERFFITEYLFNWFWLLSEEIFYGIDFPNVWWILLSAISDSIKELVYNIYKYSLLELINKNNKQKRLVDNYKQLWFNVLYDYKDYEKYWTFIDIMNLKQVLVDIWISKEEINKVFIKIDSVLNKIIKLLNILLNKAYDISVQDNKLDLERIFFNIFKKINNIITQIDFIWFEYKKIIIDRYIENIVNKTDWKVQDKLTHEELNKMSDEDFQDKIRKEQVQNKIKKEINNSFNNRSWKWINNLFYKYQFETWKNIWSISKIINEIKKVTLKKEKRYNQIDRRLYNKYNYLDGINSPKEITSSVHILCDVSGSMDKEFYVNLLSNIFKTIKVVAKKNNTIWIWHFSFFDWTIWDSYLIRTDKFITLKDISIDDVQGWWTLLSSNLDIFINRIEKIKDKDLKYLEKNRNKFKCLNKNTFEFLLDKNNINFYSKILSKSDNILVIVSDFILDNLDIDKTLNILKENYKRFKKIIIISPIKILWKEKIKDISKNFIVIDNFKID